LSKIYSWRQVAERTEKVYDFVVDAPQPSVLDRIKTSFTWGPVAGYFAIMFTVLEAITLLLTDIFWPETEIDIVRSFNTTTYNEDIFSYGNHQLYVDTKDSRKKTDSIEPIIIDNTFTTTFKKPKPLNHKRRFQTLKPDSLRP